MRLPGTAELLGMKRLPKFTPGALNSRKQPESHVRAVVRENGHIKPRQEATREAPTWATVSDEAGGR